MTTSSTTKCIPADAFAPRVLDRHTVVLHLHDIGVVCLTRGHPSETRSEFQLPTQSDDPALS